MTVTARSSLSRVALILGDALLRNRIRGVLTGGACVSLYTRGVYFSKDVDFVLEGEVSRKELDAALGTVGFSRRGDRYEHPRTPFYVEFPPGPVAIGHDLDVRPVEVRRSPYRTLALSATDCCRDRLAAFYHWNDRQSLRAAVLVAVGNRTTMRVLEKWSRGEGATEGFAEFREELKRVRRRRGRSP